MKKILPLIFSLTFFYIQAQRTQYPFDVDHWDLVTGEFIEFDGRQCLSGRANLKDVEFSNGTIEYKLYFTGERTYPAVYFRVQNPGDYEQFYMRPHRVWYDDVLQYAPTHNGASCWQLFNGDGYTAGYDLPHEQWVNIRIEVLDTRVRIFVDDAKEPSLFVNHLDHGLSSGGIVLNSFTPGLSYFADFSISNDEIIDMPSARKMDSPYGMLRNWEVSDIMNFADVNYEEYPVEFLDETSWKSAIAEPSGIVNLSKIYPRTHRTGDALYARTTLYADEDKQAKFNFGYSDVISVFLNGQAVFTGVSTYQSRNLSFLGIIGLNDILYLPLKKGDNELMILMGEGFGGWGFMFQGTDVLVDERLEKEWETDDVFSVSESVLYDPKRKVLYVSNFDQFSSASAVGTQKISKLSLEGRVLDMSFIDSLSKPLGMTIHNDQLYIAERGGFAIADLEEKRVVEHVPIPDCKFPNDIAVDDKGNVYVSDSRKNVVWKAVDGEVNIWLEGKDIIDPNTIKVIDGKLYVGNSGDQRLKSYDLETKELEVIADFVPGFIDGIRPLSDGGLLVSLWDGKLYHILNDGSITQLLDLKNQGIYIADFEFIEETGMLYIPTFFKNTVMAYKINW